MTFILHGQYYSIYLCNSYYTIIHVQWQCQFAVMTNLVNVVLDFAIQIIHSQFVRCFAGSSITASKLFCSFKSLKNVPLATDLLLRSLNRTDKTQESKQVSKNASKF